MPAVSDYLLAGGLIVCSALFSGLTLGLLSLDPSSLTILAEAGDAQERKYAKQIIPLRKNGNLLLCTLLIGNVIVNSFLSILLARIAGGLTGGIASTALIVIFGEIAPQAVCSRHGLLIGSRTRYITWFCVALFFVIAWPISKVLDFFLGREVGLMYSREELKHLLKMQVVQGKRDPEEDGIDADDHNLLAGALEYSDRMVRDVMTPIDKVFMLEATRKLDFETMLEIYKTGFTRIPVYEGGSRDRVSNMLFVKDLILVDPDDEIEVQTVVSFRGTSQVRLISDQTPLNEVFKIFKASYSHLMIAIQFRDPETTDPLSQEVILEKIKRGDTAGLSLREATGVVTLEDILEEMIRAEIVDEHDTFIANDSLQRVHKERGRPDLATFLSLFEHKAREHSKLNRQEVHAITAFLTGRVAEFAMFEDAQSQLRQLLVQSTVVDEDDSSSDGDESDEWSVDSGELINRIRDENAGARMGSHAVLYKRGVASDTFTLVLQGRVLVWAGAEEFASEVGPWQSVGHKALQSERYHPDFTACTTGPCRLIQIKRAAFQQAASTVAKVQETRSTRKSDNFRRDPSLRLRHGQTPATNGAASAGFRHGAAGTTHAAPSPLSNAGPHTVSTDGVPSPKPDKTTHLTLPGTVPSSASGEARPLTAADPAPSNQAPLAEAKPDSASSAKEVRSASNSGVLRGVVVLGEGGKPVLVDGEDWGPEAASPAVLSAGENSARSARGARRSNAEMMELELVQSSHGDATATALFRAVTPAETARRQHPGWWDGEEDRQGAAPLLRTGSTEYDAGKP